LLTLSKIPSQGDLSAASFAAINVKPLILEVRTSLSEIRALHARESWDRPGTHYAGKRFTTILFFSPPWKIPNDCARFRRVQQWFTD
jgi:hypothetical protein